MKYIRPHLSPELRAQITPHARREKGLVTAGVFFLVLSILLIVNLFPKNSNYNNDTSKLSTLQTATLDSQTGKAVLGATTDAQENQETFIDYVVKPGDTLFNISQKYQIKWDLIAELNSLYEPYVLHAGQILKVPKTSQFEEEGRVYTIQQSDTLAGIAQQFSLTIDDIIAVNPNLQKSDLITSGQIIRLP